jgi:hypothetical protein
LRCCRKVIWQEQEAIAQQKQDCDTGGSVTLMTRQ